MMRTDHNVARREIMDAVEAAGGRVKVAAHLLCVNRRTLYRLVEELRLWPQVDAVRERVVADYIRSKQQWTR